MRCHLQPECSSQSRGQAGALRLGIARSLNEIDRENNRPAEGLGKSIAILPLQGVSGNGLLDYSKKKGHDASIG